MTPQEASAMRATLLDIRARLIAEGDVAVKVERSEPVASAPDEDEAPYVEMGQSIASARNRERANRLMQIDDALRRLGDDPEDFGLCERCSEEIPPRRLELMPFARLCVDCQTAAESGRVGATRKKVTDYR